MSGVKEERSISLLLRLDLEFSESTPKTLINSLHATARNFDTPSYWTLTFGYHNVVIEINPTKNKKGQFFTTDPFLSEKCAENVDFIRELLTW